MPDGRPLGFDVDTLDDLEELCIHLAELQRSDEYSDEEEAYFSIMSISSFLSALLHYQFGFAYAYPKALKEGFSWAVGIRFPSGREFSFFAYIRRMMAQLVDLKVNGGELDKYNGMTKDFIKVMLRVVSPE